MYEPMSRRFQKSTNPHIWTIGSVCGIGFFLTLGLILYSVHDDAATHNLSTDDANFARDYGSTDATAGESDGKQSEADAATEAVMEQLLSNPESAAEVERIGGRDVALTRFQNANGISDRIAEAAIKEWVLTHSGSLDWDLAEVQAICLRNKRTGIPYTYLPESEK